MGNSFFEKITNFLCHKETDSGNSPDIISNQNDISEDSFIDDIYNEKIALAQSCRKVGAVMDCKY